MVTQTESVIPTLPEFAKQPTADIAKTLEALLGQQLKVPQQEVAGFSPTQISAMNLAMQGIGSFRPFLQDARSAQTAGAETIGLGTQIAAGADFSPGAATPFMDQYQQDVTAEALKEIDRQAAIASNQLAGKAAGAGAFGMQRQIAGDLGSTILGRPSAAIGLGGQVLGQAQQGAAGPMGPQLFDPNVGINMALQQRSQDIGYQGALAQAGASRSAGRAGMFGSILGGFLGGI